jgi:hypothetical protein
VAEAIAPFLNLTALSAMAAVGGGVGYLARVSNAGALASAALAVPTGLAAGYAVSALLRWLTRGTRALGEFDPRGTLATVLARIGESTTGEIRYIHDGAASVLPARSENGSAFDTGSEVVVLEVRDGIAWVGTPEQLISGLASTEPER